MVKEKVSKAREGLKKAVNILHLLDMYGALFPTMAKFTFFQVLLEYLPKLTICWAIKQVIM